MLKASVVGETVTLSGHLLTANKVDSAGDYFPEKGVTRAVERVQESVEQRLLLDRARTLSGGDVEFYVDLELALSGYIKRSRMENQGGQEVRIIDEFDIQTLAIVPMGEKVK